MDSAESSNITQLLGAWSQGDQPALARLTSVIYPELRRIAERYMRHERANHTLQATALVNEAFIRLTANQPTHVENRGHFFGIAATLMRQILVDHARAHRRVKRGAGAVPVNVDDVAIVSPDRFEEILQVHEALDQLAAVDERKARVVELRYFGGLSVEETAQMLHVAPNTVIRDWAFAKAWLQKHSRSGKQTDAASGRE